MLFGVGSLEQWRLKEGEELLRGLRVVPLIVLMFSPFVPNEDMELFLARRFEAVWEGISMRDFWTGRRRYAVKLKADPRVPGRLIHLPGIFYIAPDRGLISYPGQLMFCQRCEVQGNTKSSCAGSGCHCGIFLVRCGEGGDETAPQLRVLVWEETLCCKARALATPVSTYTCLVFFLSGLTMICFPTRASLFFILNAAWRGIAGRTVLG